MSRKLYPGEARKVRAMLGEGFTDIETSRALHVAQSTVSNFRNEDQNDIRENEIEPSQDPEKKEVDSENTDIERTPKVSQEKEFINKKESKKEYGGPIVYVGGRKHKEPEKEESEEEEFECECLECGGLFNGERERCPHCGTELELADYEEQTEDDEETAEKDEEESEEEEYECGKCGAVFDTLVEYCPKCGYGPLYWEGS